MIKKILIFITISFFIMAGISYAKLVRVVYMPDGNISVIHQIEEGNPESIFNKTMERDPNLRGLPYEDIDHTQLPLDGNGKKIDRKYWIKKEGGGIKIDTAKKNADKQAEKNKEDKKLSAKNKLKILGLTDEEIESLSK